MEIKALMPVESDAPHFLHGSEAPSTPIVSETLLSDIQQRLMFIQDKVQRIDRTEEWQAALDEKWRDYNNLVGQYSTLAREHNRLYQCLTASEMRCEKLRADLTNMQQSQIEKDMAIQSLTVQLAEQAQNQESVKQMVHQLQDAIDSHSIVRGPG